jgi:hypothetical protein
LYYYFSNGIMLNFSVTAEIHGSHITYVQIRLDVPEKLTSSVLLLFLCE